MSVLGIIRDSDGVGIYEYIRTSELMKYEMLKYEILWVLKKGFYASGFQLTFIKLYGEYENVCVVIFFLD